MGIYDLGNREYIQTGGTGEPPDDLPSLVSTRTRRMKPDRVTEEVKVLKINTSDKSVVLDKEFRATLDGGKHHFQKHFIQTVSIRDSGLFERISGNVEKGDRIIATIVTEWPVIDTYLGSYQKLVEES